jgi:hypothetical protein
MNGLGFLRRIICDTVFQTEAHGESNASAAFASTGLSREPNPEGRLLFLAWCLPVLRFITR